MPEEEDLLLLHQLVLTCLQHQSEKRLGVGRTDIAPPVLMLDGEAVQMEDLRALSKGVFDSLHAGFLVFDFEVDLTRGVVLPIGRDQL